MAGDYQIRGRGSVRSVMEGDRLIGHIHRMVGCSGTVTINFTKGTGSYRKTTRVYWQATWGDTEHPVMEQGNRGPVRMVLSTMKAWSNAWAWSPPRCLPRGARR